MINRTQLTVAFGFAEDWDVNGLTGNNTQYDLDKTKNYYAGKAYVTSLTANANTGENATLSITLTGCGALVKKGTSSDTPNNAPSNNGGNTSGDNGSIIDGTDEG